MALWILLSLALAMGSALGAPGNSGNTPGHNESVAAQNSRGINPVQHSE